MKCDLSAGACRVVPPADPAAFSKATLALPQWFMIVERRPLALDVMPVPPEVAAGICHRIVRFHGFVVPDVGGQLPRTMSRPDFWSARPIAG